MKPLTITSLLCCLLAMPKLMAAELELQQGDCICLVGNALGERMQHHNYWESLLHQRFAKLNLTVRNLCFPGDEPTERIRSENFGDPDAHLTHSKASVVLYFFGFNESFAGKQGIDRFTEQMAKLVEDTEANDYGNGSPRVVLISPIAFEENRRSKPSRRSRTQPAFGHICPRSGECGGTDRCDIH